MGVGWKPQPRTASRPGLLGFTCCFQGPDGGGGWGGMERSEEEVVFPLSPALPPHPEARSHHSRTGLGVTTPSRAQSQEVQSSMQLEPNP